MKNSKLILLLSAFTMVFGMMFTTGCSKDKGRSDNSGYYGGYNGGYNNNPNNPNGSVGAVGQDTYGRFTLGLRLGTNGGLQTGGQVSATGTLRVSQPLGCFAQGYGQVGIPGGGNLNLSAAQPGQITQYGQIYNLVVGGNVQNGLAVEVVIQNGGIQALPGNVNTCVGGASTELYGMVQILFRINGQVACSVPAYIDLQSSQSAAGC